MENRSLIEFPFYSATEGNKNNSINNLTATNTIRTPMASSRSLLVHHLAAVDLGEAVVVDRTMIFDGVNNNVIPQSGNTTV